MHFPTHVGASMMTHYGSDVLNWWDKAFDELVDSGEFMHLCRRASKTHGECNS